MEEDGVVTSKGCQELAAKIASLPTLPPVALSLGRVLNDGQADARTIADMMRQDQALTSRVLALVNSAYYSVPGGVSSLRRAVTYLGANTIYQVVLTLSVFNAIRPSERAAFDLRDLWKHALAVGLASEQIARRSGALDSGDAFTAGLLHDVGKVALAAACAETFERIVVLTFKEEITFGEAERRLDVEPHDGIGAALARRWNLPASVAAGIEMHHRHEEAHDGPAVVAAMVALADQICRWQGIGNGGDPVRCEPDPVLLARFGLEAKDLEEIAEHTEEQARRTSESLGVS
jgi:putative nucleotidyltransferase with HDIG domain